MAIIFVLLYLPIAVLTVMSFNNSRYMKWGGFTL
ncbi:MAG: ABC transporter permease, partial [Acutalibacteraceae bacterium]